MFRSVGLVRFPREEPTIHQMEETHRAAQEGSRMGPQPSVRGFYSALCVQLRTPTFSATVSFSLETVLPSPQKVLSSLD